MVNFRCHTIPFKKPRTTITLFKNVKLFFFSAYFIRK